MELPNAEEILKESGLQMTNFISYADYGAAIKAVHEYARRVLDVAAEEAKVDEFFDQRDCSTRAFC